MDETISIILKCKKVRLDFVFDVLFEKFGNQIHL